MKSSLRSRSRVFVLATGLAIAVLAVLTTAFADGRTTSLRYGPAELSHDGLKLAQVEGQVLSDADALAIPTEIAIVGDRLVVIDAAADSAVHVVHRKTGLLERTFGRRGGGPGEFEGAWSLDPVQGSAYELWIYDVALARLTYVDLRDDFFDRGAFGTRVVNLRTDAMPLGPVRTADANAWFSLGMYTEGRLGVYNAEGIQQGTVASLPPGASDVPPNVRQHAYQATLVPHPNRTLFAAVTRHASQIEIYRDDGSLLTMAEGPLHVEPQYEVRRRGDEFIMATGRNLRFGYVDAAASTEYVFAVFSGRTREGALGSHFMGRFVHVFDWEGNFVKAIALDADVVAIAVHEDSSALYALRHDPHPAVLRYSLAGVLPNSSEDRQRAD